MDPNSDIYIPLDIFRIISLYLPQYHLSLNKQLHNIYNKNWYCEYIKHNYPKIKFCTTNYKDLYEKSLLEGEIYHRGNKISSLNIKGIKCQPNSYCDPNNSLLNFKFYEILNFKGELILTDGFKQVLIDTEVTDFAYELYIKKSQN